MSQVGTNRNQISLPPSVQTLLRRVRRRLRRDASATGLLITTIFMICVFWGTTLLDLGWFQLQKFELPSGLRAVLLAGILPALLWLICTRVIFPIVRRVTDLDLALLVERNFPKFSDRLITSVESSAGLPHDGPLTRPMLERTVSDAARIAGEVDANAVFDASRVKTLAIVAGGLSLSIAVMALWQPGILTRWWNAFVRCEEVYHTRSTMLEMVAIAQPGDRRVPFLHADDSLVLKHPRGSDLELEITVPEFRTSDATSPESEESSGERWNIPDRVRVDVIRGDGSRSRTYVAATAASDRTFRMVITRLQEPVEIELLADDFRTRIPYRVEIVSLPGLDQIRLQCRYPEYTGWNQQRETAVTVTGSEVQLPIGTVFELSAHAGKPLKAARIVTEQFELSGDRESSRLMLRTGVSGEITGPPLVTADGQFLKSTFRIIHATSADAAAESLHDAAERQRNETESRDLAQKSGLSSSDNISGATPMLWIPSSATLRFFLHDEDDVLSVSPESLRVQGIEDKPPVVVAHMTGVDNAVTRLARIPVAGRIRDDYGIRSAGFEFLVDDESQWRPRPFRSVPVADSTEFLLSRSQDEPFEVFDVQVLELSEGQRLTLTVTAGDNNVDPHPGVTRGQPMLFRIVSVEELLSLLYTREIALRGRFEEVIQQLEEHRNDLQFHLEVAKRTDSAENGGLPEDRISLSACATRCGNGLRRQTNELNSIIEGFEEIVRQLRNNAVPPAQLAENMESTIVIPMKQASAVLLPSADRAVSEFRVAAQEGGTLSSLVATSRNETEKTITALRVILESVRDMAEFHEALRDLKAILDEQRKTLEETRKIQKNQLIDDILN